ncbi:hypothetical protein L1049_009513 [Liquidambar formosana]|uniref:RING-CH-type domain-containing protein n=1 Tax=Liquidambar formosana TaxID=63359 RepID=A0AAP0N8J1_LIQFO
MLSSSCDEAMDHGIGDALDSTSRPDSENSAGSADRPVPETVVVTRSAEAACVSGEDVNLNKPEAEVLGSSKVLVEASKVVSTEADKHSCVIDVKCGGGEFGENWDDEKVCRICHLNSDQAESSTDLIQLGCGCKDELGIAHGHCAEAWFKLKGNRLCEICGDTAKNITGVGDNRFMEEWNDNRFIGTSSNSSERVGGCWRGQPFCNFLMACLVIAFVLPWFFRVNMF